MIVVNAPDPVAIGGEEPPGVKKLDPQVIPNAPVLMMFSTIDASYPAAGRFETATDVTFPVSVRLIERPWL